MSGAVDTYQNNKNVIQTSVGTVASITLEQTGRKVAGALITPATWALNHATDGSTPSAVDVGIWGAGFFAAPAAIATGIIKAFVDDDINRKLAQIQSKEPQQYAKFIKACYNYEMAPPSVNAMTIASRGGTAWVTSVGLWVYITDARNNLVADYQPQEYTSIYRPRKPYRERTGGRFDWEMIIKK